MKRYARFFNVLAALIVILLFGLLILPVAQADDKTVTFAWDQTDYDNVTHWVLYWGATTGGPYDTGQARVDKADLGSTTQTDIIITYPPDAKTTYYYVLVAFRDDLFSENSNEVSVEGDFRIPPTTPLQLRVIISSGS